MTYRDQLQPWCIVRDLPNLQRIVVARFRRRSEAEAYMQVLYRLLPTTAHRLVLDSAIKSPESLHWPEALPLPGALGVSSTSD